MEQGNALSQRRQLPLCRTDENISASALLNVLLQMHVHETPKSLYVDSLSSICLDGRCPRELIESIWQHSYRQSEDELLLLLGMDQGSPSSFFNAVSQFPGVDSRVLNTIQVLQPFLYAQTPKNLQQCWHNGVSIALSLDQDGAVVSTRLALNEQPLASLEEPLLNLPPIVGFRAFDVFYYLIYSQDDRADILQLKSHPEQYNLLQKSHTYTLPSWVAFADDHALAKDWADLLTQCLSKKFRRTLLATLSGLLLLGQDDPSDVADGAALIGLLPSSSRYTPKELIRGIYADLLRSLVLELNRYLAHFDVQRPEISSVVTLVELPCKEEARRLLLRTVFDNDYAMNAEMNHNGLPVSKIPQSVQKELKRPVKESTVSLDFTKGIHDHLDSSIEWPAKVSVSSPLNLDELIPANRIWSLLVLASASSALDINEARWSSILVSRQIRDFFLVEWAQRRSILDFTTDFSVGEFIDWFRMLLPDGGFVGSKLSDWAGQRFGPSDFFYGHDRIYLSDFAWIELETERSNSIEGNISSFGVINGENHPKNLFNVNQMYSTSSALSTNMTSSTPCMHMKLEPLSAFQAGDRSPPRPPFLESSDSEENAYESDYGETDQLNDLKMREEGRNVQLQRQTLERRLWVSFVWFCTWWIPSSLLSWAGGMRRRDVRIAWREKVVIFGLIALLNGAIIFYMIILGRLICPDYDKVWSHTELATHQGTNDFYVGIHGNVYDITKFYKKQHSDNGIKTSASIMMPFAGEDLSDYFPPLLSVACPRLVDDSSVTLEYNQTLSPESECSHASGSKVVANTQTVLHNDTWYDKTFTPAISQYYKGKIVETPKRVSKICDEQSKTLVIIKKNIYDLSNYFITQDKFPSSSSDYYKKYSFLPSKVENMFQDYVGEDITDRFEGLDRDTRENVMQCLDNAFKYGELDFRHTAKCQAANVILLVMAGILTSVTLVKFLASIRFGPKPLPSEQNRFVLCQVPVYTEGEDEIRLALDSLTNLNYDNRRKLLVLICDGMVIGGGNDRPTPEILLDMLGVDQQRITPETKAYHAIGEGSRELNYAKVYSGLYENEGNIVPYLVIVKVGVPDEGQRPGNRGKRDSQLILMNFLNHVQKQSEMSPLELEIFYSINNVIGVDPERYDYLFTIDADTRVLPDALTRLIAKCTTDNDVAAVCGETGIQNEQQSLSTMIQVYEYFISHHLTKAFESMFGSVTCLPGCFSLYRLRTSQRGKPLFIHDDVIKAYSLRHIDTLHKKNLFSLGEDRYLTTLLSKTFPRMKFKFIADAKCETRVPSDVHVLLSQRRRWINSTVHNLAELLRIKSMCGFFLFSMRSIVFIDLLGTLMLPSVVVYLTYLIYTIASHSAPLPLISIILIAAVYGLQALVFILHRRWQHIFWMLVYLLAYPFHSFLLPIYSFWYMDDFSWGNTRLVVNESMGRKVVVSDGDEFFDPRSVPMESWSSYAARNGLDGIERPIVFDDRKGRIVHDVFADQPKIDRSRPLSTISNYTQTPDSFDAGTAAQIKNTVQQVLATSDLDAMTPLQLREKVADLLGVQFSGTKAAAVDAVIDEELEAMDD